MFLIDANNAEQYLRDAGHIAPDEPVDVRELPGGVSSMALYVSRLGNRGQGRGANDFVLKQSREKLRVADPWYSPVERNRREIDVLKICHQLVADQSGGSQQVTVPAIEFEDAENFAFAMTAAPADHQVWKSVLLSGNMSTDIAAACGRLLASLHGKTWRSATVQQQIGDRGFFDSLRVDPYYRHVARKHADLSDAIGSLIGSLDQNLLCLVHGDFSPKNLLVYDGGLMMVDFEVGHFGDPAFDLGFFVSHLALKAVHLATKQQPDFSLCIAFWNAYSDTIGQYISSNEHADLERRGVWNFAACGLSRIDGKSKVEYLSEPHRQLVREVTRNLILNRPTTWNETFERIHDAAQSN